MKNYLKGMFSGILIIVLLMGMVPAFATTMTRTIQAVFNDYQVYVNGARVNTSSEPFMIDGVTYISANDAAKMMGKSLYVSGSQIMIGEASGVSTREFLTQSYEKVGNIYAGITWVTGDVEMAGTLYPSTSTILSFTSGTQKVNRVKYLTKGGYDTFSAVLGMDDRSGSIMEDARNYATVYFYIDGSLELKEEIYRGQDPINISLDLKGASSFRIEVEHNTIDTYVDLTNIELQ